MENRKTYNSSEYNNKSEQDRTELARFFGKLLIFTTLISFLFVGLFINVLQFILLISCNLNKNNERWCKVHKKLNGQLIYILFSPPMFLLYFWSQIKITIQLDDLKLIEDARKPLTALIIPNHSYELDYMICFILADQLGNLGCYKSLSKDELKYLPIIGWSMWMSDIIFVKRRWDEDKLIMDRKLKELFNYDQFLLGLFAEGTRFTREKYEVSKEFALAKGIKPYKYHLTPRTRGFNHIIKYYLREIIENNKSKEEFFRIYNLQIMMPVGLKFKDFLNGKRLTASAFCEEIPLEQEVKEEVLRMKHLDEECPKLTKLLYDIFRRKDELVELYHKNGNRFAVNQSKGGELPYRPYTWPLLNWLLGYSMTYSLIGYLAMTQLSDSITFWTCLVLFISACGYMLRRIEDESESKPVTNRLQMKLSSARENDDVQSNNSLEPNATTPC